MNKSIIFASWYEPGIYCSSRPTGPERFNDFLVNCSKFNKRFRFKYCTFFRELTNEDEVQLENGYVTLYTKRRRKNTYEYMETLLECDTTEGNIFKEFVIILLEVEVIK